MIWLVDTSLQLAYYMMPAAYLSATSPAPSSAWDVSLLSRVHISWYR